MSLLLPLNSEEDIKENSRGKMEPKLVLSGFFWLILLLDFVAGNTQGDALIALKNSLVDPDKVLQTWDASLSTPCTWFHVTCNGNKSVTRIDLGNANLSGQLVMQLDQLPNLQHLELYSNNITGGIPEQLGNLTELVSLDLYLNSLSGPIPSTLGRLKKLRFLLLNNNNLSGEIPRSLTAVSTLQVLDLSNNPLTGDIPVSGSFSFFTSTSFANTKLRPLPASPPPPSPSGSRIAVKRLKEKHTQIDKLQFQTEVEMISMADHRNLLRLRGFCITPTERLLVYPYMGNGSVASCLRGSRITRVILGGVAAGAALLFVIAAIALAWRRTWRRRKTPLDHLSDITAEEDSEVYFGQLKRFSLRELQYASDNFSNKNILGRGGFGKVYKARLADGSLVAVKRLKEKHTQIDKLQFQTEVEMISMADHRNLLRLRGFCITPTERLLVYPYMGNGSVASCLRGSRITRVILGGVAAGAALLFVIAAIALAWRRTWRRRKTPLDHLSDITAEEDSEVYFGQLKRFSLRELQYASDNFSNKNILGRGGFGKVYKARLADGSLVAVKRLKEKHTQIDKLQFQTEVEMISMADHRNLLRLRGFCITPTERLLVYPYMGNGSVASCLRGSRITRVILGGVAAGAALLFVIAAIALAWRRTWRRRKTPLDHLSDITAEEDSEVYFGQLKRFSLRELQYASDNFSNKNILGRGGFGKVYKARLADGSLVAVKRLKEKHTQIDKLQFQTEVEMISMADHRNLLRLRGFCITPTERLLVYPYMGNGSVASCLRGSRITRVILGGVAAGAALLFVIAAIALAWRRTWRRRKTPLDHLSDITAEEDSEVYFGQLKRFSLRELQYASDNFSNKNILGRGGFGKVYKARLADGSLVAVKRLKEKHTQIDKLQFQTEVEMISMADHRNLLRLRGFCITPTERLLVYPYMGNGSVASCLRERPESEPPLDWPKRQRIALGSARGLAYLHDHCNPKIIHRDVKAANILLDEDYEAVIGDFGLATLVDHKDTYVTTVVRGTIGHFAPEYLAAGVSSEKTDVFGYGVMLLELITGQRAFDLARLAHEDDLMLLEWVKRWVNGKMLEALVDVDLQGNYMDEEVEQLIQVSLLCTQSAPKERPKMSEVVSMLEGDGLSERWEDWQKKEMSRQEFNYQVINYGWIMST